MSLNRHFPSLLLSSFCASTAPAKPGKRLSLSTTSHVRQYNSQQQNIFKCTKSPLDMLAGWYSGLKCLSQLPLKFA